MNRIAVHAAARFYAAEQGLTAEQQKSAPGEVDEKFVAVKKANPSYSDKQAWTSAWSIYCKQAAEHVNLTPKEIARKDNTGHTVVVRPQAGGGYMVAVVEIQGDKGRLMGKPYTQYVKDQSEVPKATKEVVRMLSKLGFPSDMSDASRHRHADAPVAAEEEPEESTHNPWEKRGEWNLNVYHPGGRRNLSYFMKNPQGGGGGGNTSTSSAKQVVDMAIRGTGWSSPHINKDKKDKVWVTVLQMDGEDWKPMKSWWQPIPPELLNKPEKKLTDHEYWEMATR